MPSSLHSRTKLTLRLAVIYLTAVTYLISGGIAIAQLYWDTNGSTAGIGGTGSISGSLWSPSAAGEVTTSNFTSGQQAIFAGTAGEVTLTGDFAPTGIAVEVSGYSFLTINASTRKITSNITLTNGVDFTLAPNTSNGNGQITIQGNITGGNSLALFGNQITNNVGRIELTGTTPTISVPTINISGSGSGLVGFNSAVAGAAISSNVVNNTSLRFMLGATTTSNSLTYSGKISGSGGVVFATGVTGGEGVITLTGGGSDYTGATHINNSITGVVRLGVNNGLSASTALTFRGTGGNSAGAFDLAGFNQSIASLANNDSGSVRGIVNTGASTSTLTVTGSETTVYKSIIGIPSNKTNLTNPNNNIVLTLAETHSGNLRLEGANTYTGGTNILGGTLTLGGNNILADTGPVLIGGGTLDTTNRNDTVGEVTLAAGSILGNGGTLTGSTYKVHSGEIWKALGGTGSLTKSTAGTVTLFRQMEYTGQTIVEAGVLEIEDNNVLDNSASLVVAGGTYSLNDYIDVVGTVTLSGGTLRSGTGVLTGSSYLVQNGNVDAILAGTVPLTKTSTGTVVLSRKNTYSGITSINEGVLSINTLFDGGVESSIGASHAGADRLQFGGGVLQYTGGDASTNRNATLNAGGGVLEITEVDTTVDWTGSFTGSGTLKKTGPGALRLTNKSTHAGGTILDGGTLIIDYTGPDSALGDGPLEILSGALSGAGELPSALMIHADGILAPGNSIGTLSIAADVMLAGTLEIELNAFQDGLTDLLQSVKKLTLAADSTIDFRVLELDPLDDPFYIFASYTTLEGTFSKVKNLPQGYKIDYEFAGTNIALVPVPEPASGCLLAVLGVTLIVFRRRMFDS
jgi:fibronectin-binding autotransporter adhesin